MKEKNMTGMNDLTKDNQSSYLREINYWQN